MKHTNHFIPTLIALTAACAAAPPVQAQTPTRQAFPWSSASVAQTASPTVSAAPQHHRQPAAQTLRAPVHQSIGKATSIASNVLPVGEVIYLDEQGNQITREQMQAKLSNGQNQVNSALGSASQAVQSFGQNVQQRVAPLQSVDKLIWSKAKSITSKATSFWKKPSLFKSPEGPNLPSLKTTWAKPEFSEPTAWFSKKTSDPITFAPFESLPRKGKTPTSTNGPLTLPPAQFARQNATPVRFSSNQATSFESTGETAAKSIFSVPDYEVAKSADDNSFDSRR